MEVKVTQNYVGRFNMLSNDESFSFYMSIFDNGKKVELDGVSATIHFSGEVEDRHDFTDPLENINYVVEKCLGYCNGIISSHNYLGEALAFCKVFSDNYDEINKNRIAALKTETEKEIQRLTEKLNNIEYYGYESISYTTNEFVNKRINMYQLWVDKSPINDLKEGSESYAKEKAKVDSYMKKIEYYKALVVE